MLSVRGLFRFVRFLFKVVLVLLVSVSVEGYKKFVVWLNDMGMFGGEGSLFVILYRGRCLLFAGMWVAFLFVFLVFRELSVGERL